MTLAPASGSRSFSQRSLVARLRRSHGAVWDHSIRVAAIMALLNDRLVQSKPRRDVILAGALHDIGKLTVPPGLLDKGVMLTATERALVQQHAQAGAEMLGALDDLSDCVTAAAMSHHERWDGSGYPHALASTEIPPMARLCAVADVIDAMTADDRAYRRPQRLEDAIADILAGSGRLYDPVMAAALAAVPMERIAALAVTAEAHRAVADGLAELEDPPAA